MREFTYDAHFDYDEDVNAFVVSFHDLPLCATQGRDRQHAAEMAKEVLKIWLEDMEEKNVPFPIPVTRNDGKNYVSITAQLP